MPNWLHAFGEGLAAFAGPAGAPVKFALSLHADEHAEQKMTILLEKIAAGMELTDEAIEGVFLVIEGFEEVREQMMIGFEAVLRKLAENREQLDLLLAKEEGLASQEEVTQIVSASVSEAAEDLVEMGFVTEKVLTDEISHLYGGKVKQFLAVVKSVGFPRDAIAEDVSPQQAYDDFVVVIRGLTDIQNASIFDALVANKPKSESFKKLAKAHREKTRKAKEQMGRNKAATVQDSSNKKQSTKKDKPVEFQPNLSHHKAQNIMKTVLSKAKSRRLCDQPKATHAVGVAIGCLAANTALESFQTTLDLLDVCRSDIRMEDDPIEKADSHVRVLESLCRLLEQIVTPRKVDGQNRNYLNVVFLSLPGGDKLLKNSVMPALDKMHKIAEDLREGKKKILRKRLTTESSRKSAVKALLNKQADALDDLHKEFSKIVDSVSEITEEIERDWGNDVTLLKKECP